MCQPPKPVLPKRIARVRRSLETKRMDSFKELHETLKKTAQDEVDFVKDFFVKTQDVLKDDNDEEDENK